MDSVKRVEERNKRQSASEGERGTRARSATVVWYAGVSGSASDKERRGIRLKTPFVGRKR
jgi:hypothetical protein